MLKAKSVLSAPHREMHRRDGSLAIDHSPVAAMFPAASTDEGRVHASFLPQLSFSVTTRLNTGLPGAESTQSATKYPCRSN